MALRYFFTIRGHLFLSPDNHGVLLPNDDSARAHAMQMIGGLMQDDYFRGRGFHVDVSDEAGRSLFVVPFNRQRLH